VALGLALLGLLLTSEFAALVAQATGAARGVVPAKPACASNRLIVKLRDRNPASARELTVLGSRLNLPPGAFLEETPYAKGLRRQSQAPAVLAQIADRALYLRLPAGSSIATWTLALQRHPLVEYAEPDWVVTPGLLRPEAPAYAEQWHLENTTYLDGPVPADLRMPQAWEITQGSSTIVVAVLDTGINARLPEFAGRLVPGYDFVNDDPDPDDDGDHGTAIAALLGASGNRQSAVAGIDWNCKIMPVKVLGADPDGFSSWLADGIDWAVDHGCKVINLSLAQGTQESQTVTRSLTNAMARGVIVVSITSNEGIGTILYPGTVPEVITVGATDRHDARWPGSNFGPEIDLVAPGADITTLHSDGSLWTGADGTSASAPLVSGVIALLASLRPDLTQEQARTLLCAGADDEVGLQTEDTPGFDVFHGWGRLNAYNSLVLAQAKIRSVTRSPEGSVELSWNSPPNGATKHPYRVEYAEAIEGPWTALPAGAIAYTTDQAAWSSPAPAPGHFYRLRVAVE
jgi:subtilisin family serine protease